MLIYTKRAQNIQSLVMIFHAILKLIRYKGGFMIIQPCTERYHEKTIRLICDTFKPPMFEEFPLLLGKDNMKHMWIAIDNEEVVAVVNFYVTPVILDGATISVASIGAVATAESHRGRGLSTQLLHAAEKQMKLEGVDLILISGDLPHYRRFGADPIGVMVKYQIAKKPSSITRMPYNNTVLTTLYTQYNHLKYRFYRSQTEMGQLIEAALTEDPWWDTYVDQIIYQGQLVGYMKYAIEKNHDVAYVHEVVGPRDVLVDAVSSLYQNPSIAHVQWELIDNDPLVPFLDTFGFEKEIQALHHTSKVINFNQLVSRFHGVLSHHQISYHIFFDEVTKEYIFQINGIELKTTSLSLAQQLLFGPIDDSLQLTAKQKEAFTLLLPLPFVFPNGLNYQ